MILDVRVVTAGGVIMSNLLYYSGIAMISCSVLIGIIAFIVFKMKFTRLNNVLVMRKIT